MDTLTTEAQITQRNTEKIFSVKIYALCVSVVKN